MDSSDHPDRHKDSLKKFCRCCGLPRALPNDRHPMKKLDNLKKIAKIFNINVSEDDDNVHPPFICTVCKRRLDRKKKYDTFQFSPCGINCTVCDSDEASEERFKPLEDDAKEFGFATFIDGTDCHYIKLQSKTGVMERRVIVDAKGQWKLQLMGRDMENIKGLNLPADFSREVLQKVSALTICPGNSDFQDLIREKAERMSSFASARICNERVQFKGTMYEQTIRHNHCVMWVDQEQRAMCSVCSIYRSDLFSTRRTLTKKPAAVDTSTSSRVRNDLLTPAERKVKMKNLQYERQTEKRRRLILEDRLMETEAVNLDADQAEMMKDLASNISADIEKYMPENSHQRLLWEQQMKMAKLTDARGMRWHPAVIKWCVALYSKSPAAYDMMRSSHFISLPHKTTLQNYTNFAETVEGFNLDLLDRIWQDNQMDNAPEFKRNVTLVYDEMKMKSGLVFNQRSGKLMGFVNLGTINTELDFFEKKCEELESGEHVQPQVATHVLGFLVRGICSPLRAPFGFFPCRGATTSELSWCMWEGVKLLEETGFKVRALVSDGASCNRKLYRMHKADEISADDPPYFCRNPVAPDRKLYFMCDTPHLIKTTRNNWENSGFHNKTRNLHYNKLDIKWQHLLNVWEWDSRDSATYKRLYKITDDHLYLTSSMRMKVSLAAQVLSSSVANALERQGNPLTMSTQKFVRYFNKFFDCLNVKQRSTGKRNRNETMAAYESPDDPRFKWLKEDFLGFLDEWQSQCLATPNIPLSEKRKMCLSLETLEGIRITVHSFVSLAKELLQEPGVTFLLSGKFDQDVIEEHFSKQRRSGGSNEAPNISEVLNRSLQFQVAGTCARGSRVGNTYVNSETIDQVDSTPIPTRKGTIGTPKQGQ